jgi:DNA-binding CsgD family transcriptional regulator
VEGVRAVAATQTVDTAEFSIEGVVCRLVRCEIPDQMAVYSRVGSLSINGHEYVIVAYTTDNQIEAADAGVADVFSVLTQRELEIAMLVAGGQVNKRIAARLGISSWTVASHLNRIFCKLGVRTRAEMTARVVSRVARG